MTAHPVRAVSQRVAHHSSPGERLRRWGLPWLGVTALALLLALLLGRISLLAQLDGRLYDAAITARPPQPPDDVVIVGLDEAFYRKRHISMAPRDKLARLLEVIAVGKPSVIALDVWLDSLSGDNPTREDDQLRAALLHCRRAGVPVVLAQARPGLDANATAPGGTPLATSGLTAHDPTVPYFSTAADGLGGIDFAPDGDGIYRHCPLSSTALPSLPLLAATRHAQRAGHPLSPELSERAAREPIPIDFCGGPGTVQITPAADLLNVPLLAATLESKAVFIGATLARSADFFSTPYDALVLSGAAPRRLYGIEMLAQSTVTLLRGAPRRTALSVEATRRIWLLAALVAAVVAALSLRGAVWGVGALAVAVGLVIAAAVYSARDPGPRWDWHFWRASPSLLAALFACGLGVAWREIGNARELKMVRDVFEGYVGDEVLQQLGGRLPELGGEMWDIAVLFSDIQGFSGLAERMSDPKRLLEVLNAHFSPLVEALKARGAFVDNYVGDLVMAVFGAPVSAGVLADDTANAVLAALDFARIVDERNAARRQAGEPVVEVGIGVHCGPAVVGNLGSTKRMKYTAIGDTVNLASRVESATRKYGTALLVTEEVTHACAGHPSLADVRWEFVDETTVKGRSAPVRLYRPVL